MHVLRRKTRPADRRLGTVYGEMLRPVFHEAGEHAGYTVVEVRHPHAAAVLRADGWEQLPLGAPVPPVQAAPPPPGAVLAAVLGGNLTALADALVPGVPVAEVQEALAAEEAGPARPARPVAVQVLRQYLLDAGAPAAAAPVARAGGRRVAKRDAGA